MPSVGGQEIWYRRQTEKTCLYPHDEKRMSKPSEGSSFPCGCPTRLALCSFLSLTHYVQFRRLNDVVERRAFRRSGHGQCPEMPRSFLASASRNYPLHAVQSRTFRAGNFYIGV